MTWSETVELVIVAVVLWIADASLIEVSLFGSLEGLCLAGAGWWALLRGVIRPPVVVECSPAIALQRSNAVPGIEPALVNTVKRRVKVNVVISGLHGGDRRLHLSLAPNQRFPMSGIVVVDDFTKRATVTIGWNDWRNALNWLTRRKTQLDMTGFRHMSSPLSIDQRGILEHLKSMAESMKDANKSRTTAWKGHAVVTARSARIEVVGGDTYAFRDGLVRANGRCRVVEWGSRNDLHETTKAQDLETTFTPVGTEPGSEFWLELERPEEKKSSPKQDKK